MCWILWPRFICGHIGNTVLINCPGNQAGEHALTKCEDWRGTVVVFPDVVCERCKSDGHASLILLPEMAKKLVQIKE